MTNRYKTISLKAVTAPAICIVVNAPPVLIASDHSVDYACDRCGTTLLHAEEDQVHGVLIRCTQCGTYNSTDCCLGPRARVPPVIVFRELRR